jgi:hypothetical protein
MARYIIKREPVLGRHDDLVEELVDGLTYGQKTQPAFIEQEMPVSFARHVYVIWDRWAEVPDDERSDVILRAYGKFEGEASTNIAFGIGVTGQEAVELGLLPFVVQYSSREHEALIDCEKVKKDELSNTILGTRSGELRYPTHDEAELAVERLQEALPKSKWTITQEVQK